MLIPAVATRVKQWSDPAGIWIDSSQVSPLVEIAFGTRKREIIGVVGSAVLARNDMLNMKRG